MKNNVFFYTGHNKLGNTVGYISRGVQMFRAYQPNVRNPRTVKQVLQRAKISLLSQIAGRFKFASYLGLVDEAAAGKMSTVNMFSKLNYGRIAGTTADTLVLDPSRIIVSKGTMYNASYNSVLDVDTEPGVVVINVTDTQALALNGDVDAQVLYGVLYAPDLGQVLLSEPASSTANKIRVTLPTAWTGIEVHAYGYVVGTTGNLYHKSSDSVYIGHVNID